MLLKIDDFTHYAISGKTWGVDIMKAVDRVNFAYNDVCMYGYHRILCELPTNAVQAITKVQKALPNLLVEALALKHGQQSVEDFVKYANTLVRGYELMQNRAKQGGMARINVGELMVEIQQDDGSTNIVYLTQNEDTKKALHIKLGSDIVVYTSKEIGLIIKHDDFTHILKQHYDARLTNMEVNKQSENN